MKKILFSVAFLVCSVAIFGQSAVVAEADRNAKGLRADGKIYVVIAVLLTILCGLFFYIIRLDRKITRLEKSSFSK